MVKISNIIGVILLLPFKLIHKTLKRAFYSMIPQVVISFIWSFLSVILCIITMWPFSSGLSIIIGIIIIASSISIGLFVIIKFYDYILEHIYQAVSWPSRRFDDCVAEIKKNVPEGQGYTLGEGETAEVSIDYFIEKEKKQKKCYVEYID